MLEKLFDEIKKNLRNPKLYVLLLSLILIGLLLFPYIDANVFYYNRVNNRIDILDQMTQLDIEKIQDNDVLTQEYARILSEIEKQSDGSLGSVFRKETNPTVNLIKFLTGSGLFWILAVACFFIKTFKSFGSRLAGFILIGGFGCLSGMIAKSIPTILNPMVNYIGYPVSLFIIVALLATSGSKQKKESKNNV